MRLLLASALLLAACSAEPVPECGGRFRLDASLTVSEREGVTRAGAQWNELAGHEAIRFDDGAECSVRIEEHANLATWRPSDGVIAISRDGMRDRAPGCAARADECLEAVVLHELGHALGLRHVEESGAIMSADGELVTSFAQADLAEASRVGLR